MTSIDSISGNFNNKTPLINKTPLVMADSEIWIQRKFPDGFQLSLWKSSFLTAKSFKNHVKMLKIFACGAKNLKNEVIKKYIYAYIRPINYKNPPIKYRSENDWDLAQRKFSNGFQLSLWKSSFWTEKSLKNYVQMLKNFACGAKKLKNEGLGVYFLYK